MNVKDSIRKVLREYFSNIKIRKMNPNKDLPRILPNLSKVYYTLNKSSNQIWEEIQPVDFQNSYVLESDDNLLGFYFLRENPIPKEVNPKLYPIFENLKGIEGVALGLFPEFQNLGYGRELIGLPRKLNYDYVWGWQFEDLGNLPNWLKRRKFYGFDSSDNSYVTYEFLNR